MRALAHRDYTVSWICPLEVELVAALEMLDEEHEKLSQPPTDRNVYHHGSISGHNIVIVSQWQAGNNTAATVVTQMRMTFPNIRFGLLIGIGGGVPVVTDDGMIRLGHVVVSKPVGLYSGVIQYDHGKAETGTFVRTGALAPPPPVLLLAAQALGAQRARSRTDPLLENIRRIDTSRPGLRRFRFPGTENDNLFPAAYKHLRPGETCAEANCNASDRVRRDDTDQLIAVHRGTIASGELVIKDGRKRDLLGQEYGVLCFEMEAAGVLSDFPCLVIRGISDYCDSHKNDQWHGFAAAAAAAYARQLFFHLPIEQVNHVYSAGDIGVKRLIYRSDDEERQKIAEWLSSTDYTSFQADFFNQRMEGTGRWLLETTEFRGWEQRKGVLYCPGIPGSGKTILSSIVINHLQEIYSADERVGIAYVFFDYRQQNEQKLRGILAILLKQLVHKLDLISADLNELYKRYHDGAHLQRDEIARLLVTASNAYSRVYIVVDALDECSDSDGTRDAVITHILRLQEQCNISLFTTSRRIPDITAKFEGFPSVEIRASDADVKQYAEGHVFGISNWVRKNPELSRLIVSEIVRSASGMFLLARLYIDSLRGKRSPKAIKTALSRLRTGTDAYSFAYHQAMERIEHQITEQAQLAKQVLSWLACARGALTLTELQHALAVEVDEPFFDEENLPDIEDMISNTSKGNGLPGSLMHTARLAKRVLPISGTMSLRLEHVKHPSNLKLGISSTLFTFTQHRAGATTPKDSLWA
ncbi:purine and uridine phosphorylase [Aspergillus varians]